MRVAVFGALVGTAVVVAIVAACIQQASVRAEGPPIRQGERPVGSSELIVLSSDATDTHQQVTLIDPHTRTMSVYHIERLTGKISLKSVREVRWDLLMEEFNGTEPAVRDIRAMLEQR